MSKLQDNAKQAGQFDGKVNFQCICGSRIKGALPIKCAKCQIVYEMKKTEETK